MHLKQLHIINFKSHAEVALQFTDGINCFIGANGSGKTNLLDAIHYLSVCKSYFNAIDSQNIKHDEPFFVIQGMFVKNDEDEDVYCGLKRNQRKQFKRNQKEYDRLAEHIGLFPAIVITPTDSSLITDGSEERRRLIDTIISQQDKKYLENLMSYNKVLSHRNALLKDFSRKNSYDKDTIDVWDVQLDQYGSYVYTARKNFIHDLLPILTQFYDFISNEREHIQLVYESKLHETSIYDLLKETIKKDLALEYTSVGVHKDDLEFLMNDHSIKKYGSQGQQKSFLLALKLALFEMVKANCGFKPMLLLDDIFDKLDNGRVERLLELVSNNNFGQIFITHTDNEKLKFILAKLEIPVNYFSVETDGVKSLTLETPIVHERE